MKTLELNTMGLSEMMEDETQEINGGWFLAALAITGAVIYLYNNGPDFINGVQEGFNAQQS